MLTQQDAPFPGKTYFGYLPRGDKELAKTIIYKYEEGQRQLAEHTINRRIQRAHAFYYARNPNTGQFDTTRPYVAGEKGEIVFADINEFRALLSQQRVNATATPPNWAPLAINSDTSVLNATRIARAILEHYRQSAGLEGQMKRLVETCLVMGAGWIGAVWDQTKGREVRVNPDGSIHHAGEFEFSIKTPYDIVIDPHSADFSKPNWMIVRRKVSKYDLAARYPKHEKAIMRKSMWLTDAFASLRTGIATDDAYNDTEDVCHVLEVYWARRPSLPNGRQALVINNEIVVDDFYGTYVDEDGRELSHEMLYDDIPYIRLVQSETILERFPHADSHDLLLPTELYQQAVGKIATLQTAKSNIITRPTGSSWKVEQLSSMSEIQYPAGSDKPDTITLFGADQNDIEWANYCRELGQLMAVVSDAQRAESKSGDSGSKAAFVASASQTFAAGFGRQVTKVWEDLGTHIIRTVARHADAPRVISLAGIEYQQEAYMFTGNSVAAIDRVQVHEQNPALDSPQGKVETAFKLYQMGEMTVDQFMLLARTGRTETREAENYMDSISRIMKEGEDIKQGRAQEVYVLKWDRHSVHIKQHIQEMYDMRPGTPEYVQMEAHIEMHKMHLIPGSPYFDAYALLMNGEQPLPLLDAEGNIPGAPGSGAGPELPGGAPTPGKPPPALDAPAGSGGPGAAPPSNGPTQPKMPVAPKNPATGAQVPMGPPPQSPAQTSLSYH